ncbi:MAG: caspase family protein [Spirosomataceae bacterium]
MRNCIFLLLLFLSGYRAIAQTLHAVLVADTKDGMLGASCEKDLGDMSVRLADIAQKINFQYQEVICNNEQFGKAGLTKALSEVTCSPNDVIFFYYTGHGLNTLERSSSFPLLYLKDDNNTELEGVHRQLKAKNPRFCVTLGDCCNNLFTDTRSMKPVSPLFKGIGVTSDLNILLKLFVEPQGDILITSAKRGEKATAHPNNGSLYTYNWMEALSHATSNNLNITWETLLNDSENRLQESLKTFPDSVKHHSHWVQGYKESNENPPIPPQPTTKPTVSFDEMNKFLNTLANETIPFPERNTLRIQNQGKYFSSTATVDIYIKSPEKPVQTQTIEEFLMRIVNTARLIDKFNFVEKMSKLANDGKYTLVTLQEVRQQP